VASLGGTSCARTITGKAETFRALQSLCTGSHRTIIFGFEKLASYRGTIHIPKYAFIYNLISATSLEWRNLSQAALDMLQTYRILDPSWENVRLLRLLNIKAIYVPIGNSDGITIPSILERYQTDKKLDVVLVGGCSEKHCAIATALHKLHHKVYLSAHQCEKCPSFVRYTQPFQNRMTQAEFFSNAKIIGNVYPSTSGSFVLAHFSFFLANKMFVVSESGSDSFAEDQVVNGVVFATSEDAFVKKCEYYLGSQVERDRVSSFGFDMIRQLTNAQQLRCPLFGKSHQLQFFSENKKSKTKKTVVATEYLPSSLLAFSQAFQPPECFHVVALMAGYNEADVIESSIMDLIEQGCDVYYLDNWSDDDSVLRIQQLQRRYPQRITIEIFPAEKTSTYNWGQILDRKAELANTLRADWFLHIDPDELRESPWGRSVNLRQALYIANELGYNMVNFGMMLVFQPVIGSTFVTGQTLRPSFLYFRYNMFAGDSNQVKAWKSYYSSCNKAYINKTRVSINLSSSGGHIAKYRDGPTSKVFPYNFILRHYPIRSQEHGARKIFKERQGRWNETERKKKWHTQYNSVSKDENFLIDQRIITMTYPNGDLPFKMYAENTLPCPSRFYIPHTLKEDIEADDHSSESKRHHTNK
jgi:hypothetical protein